MLDLNAELAALQSRPEPDGGVPAVAPTPTTPAPSNPAPISNANAPTHIGAAPSAGAPAPAAGVPAPAAGAALTYEQLEERHNNLRGAVADVRSTNRNLQRELETERAERARMTQNFQTLMARVAGGQAAPVAPAAQRPSPNGALQAIDPNAIAQDPLAALQQLALFANGLLAEREQQGQQMMQRQQMTQAQQQQQAQETQAMQRVALALSDHEAEFREMVAPDYDHAAEHYVNVRLAILQANGYPVEQAANAVQWELLQSANVAINQGLNPARAIYEAARTMGYTGPRAAPAPQPAPQPAPAATPYQPPAGQPDPLAHIRAGQAAANSISNATGGGIPGEVDLAAGLSLTGAAFDAWSKKFERKMRGLE